MITGNYELVSQTTGEPVNVGDEVISFRNEVFVLEGASIPQHEGSTGRIYVSAPDESSHEFFPGVCNLEWKKLSG